MEKIIIKRLQKKLEEQIVIEKKLNSIGKKMIFELINGKISDILIDNISISNHCSSEHFRINKGILYLDNLNNIKIIEIKSFSIPISKINYIKKKIGIKNNLNYLSNLSLFISIFSLIVAFVSCIFVM